ncbi:MAG: choice-of-anchor D domain-containing protein, partial [Verrucomicrobia bacterium]|nr:choice-of-anchor D domain-containing protein [Verrucomicrobiota bacterium]MBU1735820.1 choice-of-anchor D domain-containing protein [Verrucomicrobiota bacterium]MBU1855509.1 choice-of-anchor D domain-containing protein [Verrucomicrobiota bacterium]
MKHLQRLTVKAVTHLFISVVLGLSALTASAFPGVPPSITTQPSSAVVAVGQPVSLTVSNSGDEPFGYQWLKDGVILTGQTNSTLAYDPFQFTNSGSYYVVITNDYGLAISFPASLSVSNAPLQVWGNNPSGQLGNGTWASTNLPIQVTNNVVVVAAGGNHSLFVESDGTLWAMGWNNEGELGIGTDGAGARTNLPTQVTNGVVAVAGGSYHSLYVKADGTLWAMGDNEYGQLGNGTTTESHVPVLVNNGGLMTASLAKGPNAYHSLAIASVGSGVAAMTVLGTNGEVVASGETATTTKGTDFGTFTLGATAVTNTFSVTNSGDATLTISGVTTNGSPLFQCSGIPVSIAQGTASNFSIVFNPSAAGIATASVAIANNSATTPYVVNLRGVVESTPTEDGWLAINVTPTDGSWQLTAPAGYTGPTVGTGNLAAVSAVTGGYGIAFGALSGYVAPSNQSQFVTGGSTTLFAGVYLQISTNIGTPAGVAATEGNYTNKIQITWQGVAGATGYEIWRNQTNDANTASRIADIPPITLRSTLYAPRSTSTYTYDDTAISPILSYYYWVRAKTATLISPMSYVGMGYAALDPEEATGTADIAVSDLVFLPV